MGRGIALYGKKIRMNRLKDKISGKIILIPLDHGATLGPVKGIEKLENFLDRLDDSYINGVVLCKGHFENENVIKKCAIPKILHISNSTQFSFSPDLKILVGSVEQSIALGADAVSIHVNIGTENEQVMLKDFANISEACTRWGMPLLAMMYYRPCNKAYDRMAIKSIARLAQEMGADIVKVDYTGDIESFSEVIQGCSIPVLISGGEKSDIRQILQNAYEAISCGASGVAFGRNVFQFEAPNELNKMLSLIVHEGMDVDSALENASEGFLNMLKCHNL